MVLILYYKCYSFNKFSQNLNYLTSRKAIIVFFVDGGSTPAAACRRATARTMAHELVSTYTSFPKLQPCEIDHLAWQ